MGTDGLTVMMSNGSRAEAYARTWITAVWNLHWRPGGSYQIRVYNKLLEQQTNSANLIPAGWNHGCYPSWYCVKIYLSRFSEVCNRWKMMMLSVVLSIGLRLTRWYWNINCGWNHELTNDMTKRAKGEGIVRYNKSKTRWFSRASVW